jgi:hypothetical protein
MLLTFKYFGKVLILMPFNRSFECAVCSFLHFLELSKYKPIEELLTVEAWDYNSLEFIGRLQKAPHITRSILTEAATATTAAPHHKPSPNK